MDFKEMFSLVVKSCTTQVLNALTIYYNWNIKQINIVIVYLKFDIDIVHYIETPTGFKIVGKIYFLKKLFIVSSNQLINSPKI